MPATITSDLRISSRRTQRQAGQALIESGLVMLLFLVVLFGLMDFGRMVWSYTMISNGAREATRYAIVHGSASGSGNVATKDQIGAIVTSHSPGLSPALTTTTVTFTPDQSPGSTVNVAVTYNFYAIAPFIPTGVIQLKSASQMVIYQ